MPQKCHASRESHDLVNPEKSGKSLYQGKNRIQNIKTRSERCFITHKSMSLWTKKSTHWLVNGDHADDADFEYLPFETRSNIKSRVHWGLF